MRLAFQRWHWSRGYIIDSFFDPDGQDSDQFQFTIETVTPLLYAWMCYIATYIYWLCHKLKISEFVCASALSTTHGSLHPSQVSMEGSLRRQTVSIKSMGGNSKNLIQADKESRAGEKILPFILLCSLNPSPYTRRWLIFLKSAVTSSMPRRWMDLPLTHKCTHIDTP